MKRTFANLGSTLLMLSALTFGGRAYAQSDCGDCGQCVVVFHVCTGGQTCCGLTNTLLCHYVVDSEFCGSWQYFTCGGQPFPQCQGGLADGTASNLLPQVLKALLPDSLKLLHEKAERVSGLHGFLGNKTIGCSRKMAVRL